MEYPVKLCRNYEVLVDICEVLSEFRDTSERNRVLAQEAWDSGKMEERLCLLDEAEFYSEAEQALVRLCWKAFFSHIVPIPTPITEETSEE